MRPREGVDCNTQLRVFNVCPARVSCVVFFSLLGMYTGTGRDHEHWMLMFGSSEVSTKTYQLTPSSVSGARSLSEPWIGVTRFAILNQCGERSLSEPWIGVTRFTMLKKCVERSLSEPWIGVTRFTRCNKCGERSLSEPWIGVTRIWNKCGGRSLSEPWVGVTRFTILNQCGERSLSEPWIGVTRVTILNTCAEKSLPEPWRGVTRLTIWNKCGGRSLSEAWVGVTRFTILNQCPPKGFTLVGPRWTKKQDSTRLENILPEHRSTLSKGSARETIDAWVREKPRLKAARAQRMMYSTPSDDQEFDGIMKNAGRKLERRSRTLGTSLRTGKLKRIHEKNLLRMHATGSRRRDWMHHAR